MHDSTISVHRRDAFVRDLVQQMTLAAERLIEELMDAPLSLQHLEDVTLHTSKSLGNALVSGLCQLLVPSYPPPELACPCGHVASFQRLRSAQATTLLGVITLQRPYYLCPACHHGFAPLDDQLGFCPGGVSAGLRELLALLGAQSVFADAVPLVERLSLVSVAPTTIQQATEELGRLIAAEEQHAVATLTAHGTLPTSSAPPQRLYVSMDGTMVHTHEEGWKEIKLGAVYTASPTPARQRPEEVVVRAQDFSFYADFADPQTFGQRLLAEAAARGVLDATEVIVIGDGAHWIWNLVAEQFPGATQIVDWYHASQYVWKVANAVYGEETDLAKQWAHQRLDDLWAGQVVRVLEHFARYRGHGKAVQDAISYYTHNQHRMAYATYRARGIQVGSGSIESGCKHVVGARLKQAGMIWDVEGARAVAKVRTRLKSGRWAETVARWPPPRRSRPAAKAA
ncbi:MAG: hypothetical protein NVS2B7_08920 [Herpetosiphon sp.]